MLCILISANDSGLLFLMVMILFKLLETTQNKSKTNATIPDQWGL